MTPEQKARVSIDALLQQAGWHVCDVSSANIHAAKGVTTFPLRGFTVESGSFGLRIGEIFKWFVKTLLLSGALLQQAIARPELATLIAA